MPQFLRWDADGSAAVLTGARPYLDEGLTAELDEVLDHAPDGDCDVLVLELHHRRLRALPHLYQAADDVADQARTLGEFDHRDRIRNAAGESGMRRRVLHEGSCHQAWAGPHQRGRRRRLRGCSDSSSFA